MDKPIGAIWKKKSKTGIEFLSGLMEFKGEKFDFVIFENKYKQTDKQPDFKIYAKMKQEQKEQKESPSGELWGA